MMYKSIETQHLTSTGRFVGTLLVYFYFFMLYTRLQEYLPVLAQLRVLGILGLLLTIWAIYHFRPHLLGNTIIIILILAVLFGISGIGARNVSAYKESIRYMVAFFPHFLAFYILIDSSKRLGLFLVFWCIVFFCISLVVILQGGMGPGDFIGDENDAALMLSMALPFIVYTPKIIDVKGSVKLFFWVSLAFIVLGVMVTQSRGGFLGFVATLLVMWWFSKYRIRIFGLFVGIILVIGGSLYAMLPADYVEEVRSISDTQDKTRLERLRTWEVAWIMYKENPIIGVGVGNFRFNVREYQPLTSWWQIEDQRNLHGRVTHSAFFQILSETGTIGALVYSYIFFVMPLKLYIRRNRKIKNIAYEPLDKYFPQVLIASMAGFLVSGAFISVAYYVHVPFWIMMCAIYFKFSRNLVTENDSMRNDEKSKFFEKKEACVVNDC